MFLFLLLIAFGIYAAYVFYLLKVIIRGVRTGRIAHTDSRQFADRSKQPLFFWFLVVLFSIFTIVPVLVLYIALVRGISAVEFSGAGAL